MKTVIAINSLASGISKVSRPGNVFSSSEVAQLDESLLEGKNREQLFALQKKLENTFEWLGAGQNDMDDREFETWEENIRKMEGLIERIDDIIAETER